MVSFTGENARLLKPQDFSPGEKSERVCVSEPNRDLH